MPARTRLGRRAALAVVGLALLACGAGRAHAQAARVEATDALFVLRLTTPLAEVLETLRAAVEQHNYVLTRVNDLDAALRQRAETLGQRFDFDHYKVVSYCNLTLADEALRAEPTLGAFMPCRMVVYVTRGGREVVIATVRPTFLMRPFVSPDVQRLAGQVEADTLKILRMVAGE
jgi:cytochrome c oxidase cbb3-type subunit 3